jgi:hypothetical protein
VASRSGRPPSVFERGSASLAGRVFCARFTVTGEPGKVKCGRVNEVSLAK